MCVQLPPNTYCYLEDPSQATQIRLYDPDHNPLIDLSAGTSDDAYQADIQFNAFLISIDP